MEQGSAGVGEGGVRVRVGGGGGAGGGGRGDIHFRKRNEQSEADQSINQLIKQNGGRGAAE